MSNNDKINSMFTACLDSPITQMKFSNALDNADFYEATAQGFASEAKSSSALKKAEADMMTDSYQTQVALQKARSAKQINDMKPCTKKIKGKEITRTVGEWRALEDAALLKLDFDDLFE